jgi:single-stranded-DNA-specific exonuclease
MRKDLLWRRLKMKYTLISQPDPNLTVVEQILVNRGIDLADVQRYLKTTDSVLNDPLYLQEIDNAVSIFVKHLNAGDKIYIQVDSDCDGYTSSAFLLNWVWRYNSKHFDQFKFALHPGKEHGLSKEFVTNVTSDEFQLVIVPDAGSNQHEEHQILKDKGIDVIVLDHHEAHERSISATVVNPQLDSYPNKQLSGVGIVYKFCKTLDTYLNSDIADSLLDLVSLGMVADMVDMREFETRHLIMKGIANITNPFIKALIERQSYSLKDGITPIGLGFYIAPMINAIIRVGEPEEKRMLFQSMLEKYAYNKVPSTKRGAKAGDEETYVEQCVRQGTNIRSRQNRMRDAGLETINAIIQEQGLDKNKIIIVETSDIIDKNLSGLIANQLMYKYQRPVLLLRNTGDGMYQGSGRGYDRSDLSDLKTFLNDSDLVEYAEGHANAFGVGMTDDNRKELISYSNEELKDIDFSPRFLVDFVFDADNIRIEDLMDIGNMKDVWGKGLDEAMIVVQNLRVTKDKLTLMSADNNPTLKIQHGLISFIKFKSSREELAKLSSEGFIDIDLIGKCSINEWNGNITPQILVENYEIKNTQTWYF